MADCKYCTNYHLNSREERTDDCCFGKGNCRKEYFFCNEGLKPKAATTEKPKKPAKNGEVVETKITRRFDDLGRINIPKDIRRKALGTRDTEGTMMEIFYKEDGTIILKPWKVED